MHGAGKKINTSRFDLLLSHCLVLVFPNMSFKCLSAVVTKQTFLHLYQSDCCVVRTATDCRFFAIRLLCVCMVILGIQTAVAIVTHQATCCALISVPWTAPSLSISFYLSLSHPHTVVQHLNILYWPGQK